MSSHLLGLDPTNFTNQLLLDVVITLIVTIIVAGIGLFFNKRIRKYIKLGILWLKDDNVSLTAFYTKKYDFAPTHMFDNDIFEQLNKEVTSDKINKVAVNPKFIRLYSENLGMKINISLEEEPDLSSIELDNPKIVSYNVIVSMDAEIKGIRQLDRIEYFTNLSESIHNIIRNQCFPEMGVRQSFVICDVSKIETSRTDVIEDSSLESEISFSEKTIKIKTKSPQTLRKTVKRYVYA